MADELKNAAAAAGEQARKTADAATRQAKDAVDRGAKAAKAGADTLREAGERAQQGFREKVADPAARAGAAIQASGQKLAEGGSALGVKMIEQAESNAQEAFTAMRAAAQAKDLAEVIRIQGDYLREQGNRSMAQAREMGELILQFGRDAVAPLKGGPGG